MELEYEPLPLKTQLPDLRPAECVDLCEVLEDKEPVVAHAEVESDSVFVCGSKYEGIIIGLLTRTRMMRLQLGILNISRFTHPLPDASEFRTAQSGVLFRGGGDRLLRGCNMVGM